MVWAIFFLLAMLTALVYEFGWATDDYQLYLGVLGIVSLISAISVLLSTRLNWPSVILILMGLLVGQWWFIQGALMQASWLMKGFV